MVQVWRWWSLWVQDGWRRGNVDRPQFDGSTCLKNVMASKHGFHDVMQWFKHPFLELQQTSKRGWSKTTKEQKKINSCLCYVIFWCLEFLLLSYERVKLFPVLFMSSWSSLECSEIAWCCSVVYFVGDPTTPGKTPTCANDCRNDELPIARSDANTWREFWVYAWVGEGELIKYVHRQFDRVFKTVAFYW